VLLEEAISESIRTGARQSPNWIVRLSEVCRLAGFHEEACQHAHQALNLARQQKVRGEEAGRYTSLAPSTPTPILPRSCRPKPTISRPWP